MISGPRLSEGIEERFATSAYDTYTQEDLDQLLFSYGQIVTRAAPRPVHAFIIPRYEDFVAHARGRFQGRIVGDLRAFAERHPRVTVVDLLPHFLAYAETHAISAERFFLEFDSHWSPLGHRVAAEAVRQSLMPDGKLAARL